MWSVKSDFKWRGSQTWLVISQIVWKPVQNSENTSVMWELAQTLRMDLKVHLYWVHILSSKFTLLSVQCLTSGMTLIFFCVWFVVCDIFEWCKKKHLFQDNLHCPHQILERFCICCTGVEHASHELMTSECTELKSTEAALWSSFQARLPCAYTLTKQGPAEGGHVSSRGLVTLTGIKQ